MRAEVTGGSGGVPGYLTVPRGLSRRGVVRKHGGDQEDRRMALGALTVVALREELLKHLRLFVLLVLLVFRLHVMVYLLLLVLPVLLLKHVLRHLFLVRNVAGQIGSSRFHIHRGFPSRAWGRVMWRCDLESVGVVD